MKRLKRSILERASGTVGDRAWWTTRHRVWEGVWAHAGTYVYDRAWFNVRIHDRVAARVRVRAEYR